MSVRKRSVSGLCFIVFLFVAGSGLALAAQAGDAAAGGGSAFNYVDGRLGQAVSLDGKSQSVKIPHYAGLKPAKQITIAAWIKPEKIAEGWLWQEIYRKEDGDARSLLAIGQHEGKHCLCFGLGIGERFVECGAPLPASQVLDGKWHLVCVTYDGKAIRLYADGKEIGVVKASGAIMTSGESPAFIGSAKGSEEFFPGGIDDLRIYNRALSAAEIKALARADGKATVNGLTGWWKLDGNLKNSATASQTKPPEAQLLGEQTKELTVDKTYLLMPINNRAERNQRISLVVDGKEVRHVGAGLAEKKEDADWWAFFDVARFKGRKLAIEVTPAPKDWKIKD